MKTLLLSSCSVATKNAIVIVLGLSAPMICLFLRSSLSAASNGSFLRGPFYYLNEATQEVNSSLTKCSDPEGTQSSSCVSRSALSLGHRKTQGLIPSAVMHRDTPHYVANQPNGDYVFQVTSSISNVTAILTAGTPENCAYEWIQDDFYNFDTNFTGADDLQQRYILALLYCSIDGLGSTAWMDHSSDECSWNLVHIGCTTGGSVQEINIANSGVTGTLPTELGLLSEMTNFALHDNFIHGTIPTELAQLSKLVSLDLSNNRLSGTISPHLGDLTNLLTLALGQNQLSGPIPKSMSNLRKLKKLLLNNNILENWVPSTLGLLTDLQTLRLENNPFAGYIGPALSSLTDLTDVRLDGAGYTGYVPIEICEGAMATASFPRAEVECNNVVCTCCGCTNTKVLEIALQVTNFYDLVGAAGRYVQTQALAWAESDHAANPSKTDAEILQRYILAVMYYASGERSENWLDEATDECTHWPGITCNARGAVTQIKTDDISSSVNRNIPSELAGLTALRVLDLDNVEAARTIPQRRLRR